MAHTRRSPPDEPDDNSDDSAHSWLLQVALEPSGQLVATLQNNYLFSFTLRKAHLRGGLHLQLYDTHAGTLCVRHVWPYYAVPAAAFIPLLLHYDYYYYTIATIILIYYYYYYCNYSYYIAIIRSHFGTRAQVASRALLQEHEIPSAAAKAGG